MSELFMYAKAMDNMLLGVLKESFSFLVRRPLFFIPRLAIDTVWNVLYLSLFATLPTLTNPQTTSLPPQFTQLIIAGLVLSQLSIFVHSLYPPLTQQLKEQNGINYKAAMWRAIQRFPQAFIAYNIPFLIVFLLAIPALVIASVGVMSQSWLLIGGGIGFVLLLVLGTAIILYFVPSRVILEDESGWHSLTKGPQLSRQYSKEAIILTVFSFALLALAMGAEGALKTAGIIGFWIGRYIGSIIGVYMMVVNADIYLEVAR